MNNHPGSIVTTIADINSINSSMGMVDNMSDDPSSPDSSFDESDILHATVSDDVTAQLAAAGPIGVAAAAAIATGKKRKRPHSFETNPSVRKRQQTRLLRKLRATIEEFNTRVGQQAIVLCCVPAKHNQPAQGYKVFGSQPLESVIRNCRSAILQELETALAQQTPAPVPENPSLYELPPLIIDGIPTPVDKMTQAQLRAFIPEMLKYSTMRSKPGWGKMDCKPQWWPQDVPWANVRSDVRTEEQKSRVSWTHALRSIVKNCYKHHCREDLMPDFNDNDPAPGNIHPQTMVQTINNPDGTMSIIQIDTGDMQGGQHQVVTLADGTQAQVVHAPWQIIGKSEDGSPLGNGQEANQAVQTLAEMSGNEGNVSVEVNQEGNIGSLTEATLNSEGQLVLTGDAASALAGGNLLLKAGNLSGMVTIPVSMYQTVVTNMNQLGASNIQVALASGAGDIGTTQIPTTSISSSEPTTKQETQSGVVPDATQAVEVMTIEPSGP